MGIWAQTSLDNDTAADFVGRLSDEAEDWSMVADTLACIVLTEAIHGGYHRDSALEGLAAAEVVASALGRPTASGFVSSQEALEVWTRKHPLDAKSLIPTLAQVAASRFTDESNETQETTYPGADTSTWTETFDDLRARLTHKPGDPGIGAPPTPAEFAILWQDMAAISPDAALAIYTATDAALHTEIPERAFKSLFSGPAWRVRAAKAAWAQDHPRTRSV